MSPLFSADPGFQWLVPQGLSTWATLSVLNPGLLWTSTPFPPGGLTSQSLGGVMGAQYPDHPWFLVQQRTDASLEVQEQQGGASARPGLAPRECEGGRTLSSRLEVPRGPCSSASGYRDGSLCQGPFLQVSSSNLSFLSSHSFPASVKCTSPCWAQIRSRPQTS